MLSIRGTVVNYELCNYIDDYTEKCEFTKLWIKLTSFQNCVFYSKKGNSCTYSFHL
jgi:hypothetical protein